MRPLTRLLPSQRTRTIGAFSALTVTLATLAVLHDGTEVADLHLNDGGVWVTNLNLNGLQVAAHLNYPSKQIDANTKALPGAGLDLSQEANAVVLTDDAQALRAVDTATWAVDAAPAQLPDSFQASQGKDVVAIADPNQGKVWAVASREVAGFNPESVPPVLEGALGVRLVTGKDDVIHTVVPNGTLRDLSRHGTRWTIEKVGSTPDIAEKDMQAISLTAVGGTGAVFNPADGWVAWPGHSTDVDGAAGLVLQQPGDDVGLVALAGPSGLVEVPLDGGDVATVTAPPGGRPIAPVTIGECAYAAWVSTGAYLRDCADDAMDEDAEVYPQLTTNTSLVFRTNRDVVVLNDPSNGDIFLVNEDMEEISDWNTVLANLNQDEKDEQDKTIAVTQRSEKNTRPDPKDDDFGVRPGRSVTLPVLANDLDADGDVLLARLEAHDLEGIGRLELVRDGRAVRITVDAKAAPGQKATFAYTADDGRENGSADAKVNLTVRGDADNGKVSPMVPGRDTTQTIRARGQGEHHVLQEWKDPDGDPFWVSQVEYGEGLSGTYRPDGLVTVRDDGRPDLSSTRVVKVTLTDGRPDGSRTVDLPVRVLPVDGKAEPIANADFVSTLVSDEDGDRAVTVRPLHNDLDPNGDDLFFSLTGKVPQNLEVVTNEDDSLTITSSKAGTEYLEYSVTDGTATVTSVVRVDTLTPEDARPVPDNDLAVLPPHGDVLVDVLSNDTDPLGGVLVVESVNVGQASAVTAEVVDHEVIKINDVNLREGQPVDISYEVGNGTLTGTGTVTVVLDPARQPAAPVAADDAAVVRSGDVLSVDVLDNDLSPTDLPLEVLPLTEDAVTEGADLGQAWVSENKVRFKATGESGIVRVQYTVRDTELRTHSATVVITVVPVTGANSAPTPAPLTGRLVQGGEAEIRVPLEGVDPDGDSVALAGLDIENPPRKGSVTIDGDTMTYRAAGGEENRGTDSFSYVVEDEFGQQASGEVQIGVAAPPSNNLAPIAQADRRRVRPGRVLAVPVTANDIDPEGGALAIVKTIEQVDGPDAEAEVVDGRVRLTTPADEGTLTYRYTVRDDLGASSSSQLVVEVSQDAPALPPVARDDRVPVTDIIGRTEVTVDVLRNDEDPDGAVSELTPEVDDGDVRADADGRLVVPVTAERQVIVYSLTDPDGQVGRAVVVVPGSQSPSALRPALRPGTKLPIEVDAGTAKEIPLEDYVVVRDGRSPHLPFSENVVAGPGHDGSPLKTGDDVITFGAKPDFYGPTAVVATISDGSGDGDADALVGTLTLPIFVNATGNTQPDLRVPAITVAPQEGWTGDLDLMATDPDPGDQERLEFSIEEKDPALKVDVDEDERTITVEPENGAEPSTYLFDLVVSDGRTAEVRRTARVTVVESTREKIAVGDAELDATAGEETVVDIGEYVTFNPFEDDGKPVELVSGPTLTAGDATLKANGLQVAITPGEEYFGTLTATYVLRDATGLPDRQVQGEIILNVRGFPSPPTTVTADAGNAQVEVDWSGAEPNGAPITGYRVVWTGSGGDRGEATTSGPQTTYTAKGLKNGTEYRFQVFSINEVGESKSASGWSRDVTPDYVPATPANVKVSFDDGRLHVTWTQPDYDGTDITGYQVAVNGQLVDAGTDTSEVLPGLTNGTSYAIKVRGLNKAEADPYGSPGASAWSSEVTEHPNGEPTVSSVSILADAPDDDPSAEISWDHDDHGHPVADFEVRRLSGSVVPCAGAKTGSSCRVSLAGAGRDQQFQVRLFNRANADKARGIDGWGEWSTATPKVTGATPPAAVTDVSAVPTGSSGGARVTWSYSTAQMNNADSVKFYVRNNKTGTVLTESGTGTKSVTFSGLPNGTNTTFTVTAQTTANAQQGGGTSDESPEANGSSDPANAFGACLANVSGASGGYRSVSFDWKVTDAGRSCTWTDNHGRTNGSGPGGSGTVNFSVSPGQSVTFTLTAKTQTSGEDPTSFPNSTSASSQSATAWADSGYNVRHDGPKSPCQFSDCTYVSIQLFRWRPSSTVYCFTGGVGAPDWWSYIAIGGDGSSGWTNDGPNGRLFDSPGGRFRDGTNTGEFTCTQQ